MSAHNQHWEEQNTLVTPPLQCPSLIISAGYKPIWPISSNQVLCQRGLALRLQQAQTYTFYRSWWRHGRPVFFKLFWETKKIINFFQRFLKIQYELALLPQSKSTKTLIYKHLGIQMKQLRPLKKSLQWARSKLKTLEVRQYFVSVGYLANENPSELRGF